MLKKYPIMLCYIALKIFLLCSTNAPTMLKIMLIKCDSHSKNQPSGLFYNFKYAWVVRNFIISSMFAALDHSPTRSDGKRLVAC